MEFPTDTEMLAEGVLKAGKSLAVGVADSVVGATVRVGTGVVNEMPLILFLFATVMVLSAVMLRRHYQLQQLTTNNGQKRNLWKINDKFYDLVPFLEKHPGGARILKDVCRTDCTTLMEMYHCLKDQDKIQKTMRLYEVAKEELKPEDIADLQKPIDFPSPLSSPLYQELAQRVRVHLDAIRPAHGDFKATWPVFIYYWVMFAMFVLLYPGYAYDGSIASALVCGTIVFSLGVGCLHDGIHTVLSRKEWVNDFFAIVFGSSHDGHHVQLRVHVVNHHANTNVEDQDADAHLALGIGHYELVDKKNQPAWLAEALCHFQVFIKACMGPASVYYLTSALFTLCRNNMYRTPFPVSREFVRVRDMKYNHQMDVFSFLDGFARLVWIYVLAFHPFFVAPTFLTAVQQVILYHASWGVQVYITAMCVHDNSKCDTVEPYIPGACWAKWQITHGVDFNPYSTICNYWSIGQNNQVAHHLFPGLHWVYYPAVSKIIADFCEEKKIQYHAFDSTWGMWVGHVKEVLARQPPFDDDCRRPACYGYKDEGGEDFEKRAQKLAKFGIQDVKVKVRSTWLSNQSWEYGQEAVQGGDTLTTGKEKTVKGVEAEKMNLLLNEMVVSKLKAQ